MHHLQCLGQGRNMPICSGESLPFNANPTVQQASSKAVSLNMCTSNADVNRTLMQLAYQQYVRAQKWQIDAAIRLLQNEYDAIMLRINHQISPVRPHKDTASVYQHEESKIAQTPSLFSQNRAVDVNRSQQGRAEEPIYTSLDEPCSQTKKRNRDEAQAVECIPDSAQNVGHGKVVLTSETACEIYQLRPKAWDRRGGKSDSQSSKIAAKYGVTAKTVRDIWNRLTWAKATRDLWTEEEVEHYLQDRRRKSSKLDPAHGLPTWCAVSADKDRIAACSSPSPSTIRSSTPPPGVSSPL